jgi:hypothetical protein
MESVHTERGNVMSPLEINEVQEVPERSGEVSDKTKAFENEKVEEKSLKHITTINEGLVRQKYPGTEVIYRNHKVMIDGERVEGVFPKFDSKFDTMLPTELRTASDTEQFKYCTGKLAKRVENDPDFASQFTPRQLEQIKNEEPRISGLTWHHNEVPGKMQLVDAEIHNTCRHTGGRSIWGGGSEYR